MFLRGSPALFKLRRFLLAILSTVLAKHVFSCRNRTSFFFVSVFLSTVLSVNKKFSVVLEHTVLSVVACFFFLRC